MRAAIFRNGEIVVDQMPEPKPGPGMVLVKSLACGICGSDLHARKHAHRMVELAKHFPGRKPMDLSRDVVFGRCEVSVARREVPAMRINGVKRRRGDLQRWQHAHEAASLDIVPDIPDGLLCNACAMQRKLVGGVAIVDDIGVVHLNS